MLYGNPDGVYAKVIADSITELGHRVTTMEVQDHRYMLPEFNTHRKFSRNSRSSRAIPFRKTIEEVMTNPAIPVKFTREKSGMQGGETLTGHEKNEAITKWLKGRDAAVKAAQELHDLGVHKSIVNRMIEPYMWHRIIVTSTEWGNFFAQRDSLLAQPDIQALAQCMKPALANSEPVLLGWGQWHLPYVRGDEATINRLMEMKPLMIGYGMPQVSAARSARVSYLTHEGTRDVEKDLGLYSDLHGADPRHASPMEHPCTPAHEDDIKEHRVLGNFDGWHQLRHVGAQHDSFI